MILEEKYTLSNDVEIPKLGLGTWFINDKDVVNVSGILNSTFTNNSTVTIRNLTLLFISTLTITLTSCLQCITGGRSFSRLAK